MASAHEKRTDIENCGVSTPVPMTTESSPTPDKPDEHLETLKCLTMSLKKELNLGKSLEPKIVKIDSYIDCLNKKCAPTDDKPSCTNIPPLSRNVKTPQCKLEGSATCYSTGYICFFLRASRQETEAAFKPILFDVKLFLRHPEDGDPWMVGEKQLILRDNKKVSSPQVVLSYRDIQNLNYVKDDTITFWWQVWVRENPKEIDLDLTQEILSKMAIEAKKLRELSNDCEITEIADLTDSICMSLDSSWSTEPLSFHHCIDKYEKVLLKNNEIYTSFHESSSHGYRFQGFLLCKEDNRLTAYLYLGPLKETDRVIWPVKIHWRLSLLNQASGKRKIMGEKISLYDKATPSQTSLLHYQGRIEFNKDSIEWIGLILDHSLTVEWTVWLDSSLYAVDAAKLTHQCDQFITSARNVLTPNQEDPDNPDTADHSSHPDSVQQHEESTKGTGYFDLMLMGKSGQTKRLAGNSILQQNDFTKDKPDDAVEEALRQIDENIVTVVDCPLICNLRPGQSDKYGLAGNRLDQALVKSGDGFHAILYVFDIDETFSDKEFESIMFLKTHLADNVVRDFFVFVMICNQESNTESECEFDLLGWCKAQTDVLGDLLKECNYRCVLFYDTIDKLSVNKAQRNELLSIVSQMKVREFRLKKKHLNWNHIPGSESSASFSSDRNIETILKRTQILVQAFKEAKLIYTDPEAAKSQIDDLEKRACLLEKEVSTRSDGCSMMKTLKTTVIHLRAAIASDRDIIEESKNYKERIKQTTTRCEELEEELRKTKEEYEQKLKVKDTQLEEVEALQAKIVDLESKLSSEQELLINYKQLFEESEQKIKENYENLHQAVIKEYEEMKKSHEKLLEQKLSQIEETPTPSEMCWSFLSQQMRF